MNNSLTRRAAPLLLVSLLLQTASCASEATIDTETTTASDTAVESTDARLALDDKLPEKDFYGAELCILAYDESGKPEVALYALDEATGDIVDDAIYERNQRVEERFNCTITEYDPGLTDWQDHTNFIKTSVMAGEDEYDITYNHIIGGPNNSLDGVYMNLYDLEYLDFDQPWWSEQMIDEMTLRDQIYAVGDVISLGALKSAKVFYINKDKFADYNLELPYNDVFDGSWTMDKFMNLTKDIYEDVNGNSERDLEDFYGFISHSNQNGWHVSCDIQVGEKDPNETLKVAVDSDKLAAFVEKIYRLYFESEGTLTIRGNDPETGTPETDWQANLFADGRGLIAFSLIRHASTTFRESNVEYGIIPFPKWDENQESYRTFCGGTLIGIPVTVSDQEMVGILLEALVAESYKTVVPAYFKTALKEKFTFDSESAQTLDIINDTLAISFAYAYNNFSGFQMIGPIMGSDNPAPEYASYLAANLPAIEARVELICDYFEANE